MKELDSFTLTLESNRNSFCGGEVLQGSLLVTLNEPAELRNIKVQLFGEGVCRWDRVHGQNCNNNRTKTPKTEEIVKLEKILFGPKDGEATESVPVHPIGSHRYDFELHLPKYLPCSFESPKERHSSVAYIRYFVAAFITRPWQSNVTRRRTININEVIDTSLPQFAYRPGCRAQEQLGSCFSDGFLYIQAYLDQICYRPEDTILISAVCENDSNRIMSSVYAKLFRRTRYMRRHETKTYLDAVAEYFGERVLPKEFVSWENLEFKIPSHITPSVTKSRHIHVDYFLRVGMYQLFRDEIHVDLPVVIGTTLEFLEEQKRQRQQKMLASLPTDVRIALSPRKENPTEVTDRQQQLEEIADIFMHMPYTGKRPSVQYISAMARKTRVQSNSVESTPKKSGRDYDGAYSYGDERQQISKSADFLDKDYGNENGYLSPTSNISSRRASETSHQSPQKKLSSSLGLTSSFRPDPSAKSNSGNSTATSTRKPVKRPTLRRVASSGTIDMKAAAQVAAGLGKLKSGRSMKIKARDDGSGIFKTDVSNASASNASASNASASKASALNASALNASASNASASKASASNANALNASASNASASKGSASSASASNASASKASALNASALNASASNASASNASASNASASKASASNASASNASASKASALNASALNASASNTSASKASASNANALSASASNASASKGSASSASASNASASKASALNASALNASASNTSASSSSVSNVSASGTTALSAAKELSNLGNPKRQGAIKVKKEDATKRSKREVGVVNSSGGRGESEVAVTEVNQSVEGQTSKSTDTGVGNMTLRRASTNRKSTIKAPSMSPIAGSKQASPSKGINQPDPVSSKKTSVERKSSSATQVKATKPATKRDVTSSVDLKTNTKAKKQLAQSANKLSAANAFAKSTAAKGNRLSGTVAAKANGKKVVAGSKSGLKVATSGGKNKASSKASDAELQAVSRDIHGASNSTQQSEPSLVFNGKVVKENEPTAGKIDSDDSQSNTLLKGNGTNEYSNDGDTAKEFDAGLSDDVVNNNVINNNVVNNNVVNNNVVNNNVIAYEVGATRDVVLEVEIVPADENVGLEQTPFFSDFESIDSDLQQKGDVFKVNEEAKSGGLGEQTSLNANKTGDEEYKASESIYVDEKKANLERAPSLDEFEKFEQEAMLLENGTKQNDAILVQDNSSPQRRRSGSSKSWTRDSTGGLSTPSELVLTSVEEGNHAKENGVNLSFVDGEVKSPRISATSWGDVAPQFRKSGSTGELKNARRRSVVNIRVRNEEI
eukprot:gene2480-2855_t